MRGPDPLYIDSTGGGRPKRSPGTKGQYLDNRNANSDGLMAVGAFSGHYHCVWDGNDLASEKCRNVVNVR